MVTVGRRGRCGGRQHGAVVASSATAAAAEEAVAPAGSGRGRYHGLVDDAPAAGEDASAGSGCARHVLVLVWC